MDFPVDVVFRDLKALPYTQEVVRQRVLDLGRYYEGILRARIVIEQPHQRRLAGNPYQVTIQLSVPGEDVIVSPQPQSGRRQEEKMLKSGESHPEEKHLEIALRAALDRARRRLEDHARIERGQAKTHETPEHGRIVRLFPVEGYGFIATADGREFYFHRNSLLQGKFDRLQAGAAVSFLGETGDPGPQASSVRLLG